MWDWKTIEVDLPAVAQPPTCGSTSRATSSLPDIMKAKRSRSPADLQRSVVEPAATKPDRVAKLTTPAGRSRRLMVRALTS